MKVHPDPFHGPKKVSIGYLLTLPSFFGCSGIQRFYLGKYGTGLLYLLTGGLFFLGTLYDLVTMERQVREVNMLLGYSPRDWDGGSHAQDSSIIEARYSIYEEKNPVPQESLEARIVSLAEEAELNQLTLRDLIKAGIELDDAKASLERLVREEVCEEVSLNGVKHFCF
jgi:hypothetical protein